MSGRYYYDLRCHICGKFVKPDADRATPYGSCTDLDEPDAEFFCPACAEREKEERRKKGSPPDYYWRQPQWAYDLAEELGQEQVYNNNGFWHWRKKEQVR